MEIHLNWTLAITGERTRPKSERSMRVLDMTTETEALLKTQKIRQEEDAAKAGSNLSGNPMNLIFTSQFGQPFA